MPDEELIPNSPTGPARTKDEIALELMKFIAVNTGYGRQAGGAGFSTSKAAKSPEEHAESLIELFQRCRTVVEG